MRILDDTLYSRALAVAVLMLGNQTENDRDEETDPDAFVTQVLRSQTESSISDIASLILDVPLDDPEIIAETSNAAGQIISYLSAGYFDRLHNSFMKLIAKYKVLPK